MSSALSSAPSGEVDIGDSMESGEYPDFDDGQGDQVWKESHSGDDNFKVGLGTPTAKWFDFAALS